jgi:regulator of sigma E protease
MGTKLWSATRNGTLYALRLLPIGGYVRLAGMEQGDYEAVDGFHSKSAWQRVLVLLAGPGVNFLVAAIVAMGLAFTQVNTVPGLGVQVVVPSPAYAAGIRPRDQITAVDGKAVSSGQEIQKQVADHPDQALNITVRHPDGKTENLSIQPEFNQQFNRELIGVKTAAVFTPTDAVMAGVTFPITTTVGIAGGLYALASGQIPGGLLGPQGATGAIGIGYLTIEAANQGLSYYLYVLAILSMALGLANLLPLPALDGGRIVVVLLEKLRGRPFNREKEMQLQRVGLAALLALVAFIAYFDIQRIINHQFPGFGQ